jgi:acyl-CoA synthetase (AMP-forming)/AMP-acid ligase II
MTDHVAPAVSPWQTSLNNFAARYGDRVAVSSRGRTLTYAQLAAQAEAVRAAVVNAGVKPGEPVAIVAKNGPGVVVASYGVMASGAAEFVVDLNLGPDDVSYAAPLAARRRSSIATTGAGTRTCSFVRICPSCPPRTTASC